MVIGFGKSGFEGGNIFFMAIDEVKMVKIGVG